MTAIRMIKATKSTAPKDIATIITEGEELLLSSMMTLSVDIDLSVDFASSVGIASSVDFASSVDIALSVDFTSSVDIASSVDFASYVDFAVVGVETVVEDPRIKALIIDIKPSFTYPK